MTIPANVKKLLAFGTGVGIEIGAESLDAVAARVRPTGVNVLGRLEIADYATRPAADWGAEYSRWLKSLGAAHLSATVLMPRRDVIVRTVALPGVAPKDLENAIRFQLDTLHPYGEDEICWGWSPLGFGSVLVGIARRSAVEHYNQLFTEAGIAVASFTFSAAAVHAAIRLNGAGREHPNFLALSRSAAGAIEAYGESASKPVFSAEFVAAPDRATVLALSELRLPPDTVPLNLQEVLPKPQANPVSNDLSRNALPYATALAGACPRLAPAANVLPAEHRRLSSRAVFIPTLVLAVIAIGISGAIWFYAGYSEGQYLHKLQAERAQLEPTALRAAALDRQIDKTRARSQLLDQYRRQTRADLDALNELTRLVEPPAWTTSISLNRDSARIAGEAPQASTLLRILDSSQFFENSSMVSVQRAGAGETFTILTNRRKGK